MKATLEQLSVGCNRTAGAIDWGENGCIAYAAHNAVIVYDVQAKRVIMSLLGHKQAVGMVKWIPSALSAGTGMPKQHSASQLLASASADNTVIIWAVDCSPDGPSWMHYATLGVPAGASSDKGDLNEGSVAQLLEGGHAGPVTGLACHAETTTGDLLLGSVGADARILIWRCTRHGRWALQQALEVPGGAIQNCLALSHVPGKRDWLMMATGGVDSAARVFVCPPGGKFHQKCVLKGHENWIRGMSIVHAPDGRGRTPAWLASASQDRMIRLWTITPQPTADDAQAGKEEASDGASFLTAFAHKHSFSVDDTVLVAEINTVLIGHEDWVHSVAWQRTPAEAADSGGMPQLVPRLLSAAMDRTMMLWERDVASGLWLCVEAVGDAVSYDEANPKRGPALPFEDKLGCPIDDGADSLGYYTGVFSPDMNAVAANGYTGALHIWRRAPPPASLDLDESASSPKLLPLVPEPAACGHYGEVVDLCWGIDGRCLLSVSTDQTARIITCNSEGRWFELARPQVHGHDFTGVALLPQAAPAADGLPVGWRFVYVSSSDEKVLRVFQAPTAFLESLAALRGVTAPVGSDSGGALGAAAPALGLSNKAVSDAVPSGASDSKPQYEPGPDLAPNAAPVVLTDQPLEEQLSQSTLWPETHKLYGHGNDVYTLAACPRGTCIVSASKAQSAAAAALRVWDVSNDFRESQVLTAHGLTVTQLAFTRDGRFLLSVSRDRSFCIHQALESDAPPTFKTVAHVKKAHDRIIWTGAWAPDSRIFATGSRDKVLRLWRFDVSNPEAPQAPALSKTALQAAVTAVTFSPRGTPDAPPQYTMAVGFESGAVEVFRVTADQDVVLDKMWCSDMTLRAAGAIRKLAFNDGSDERMLLAIGSSDHAIRVLACKNM